MLTESAFRQSSDFSGVSDAMAEALYAWRVIYTKFVNILIEKLMLNADTLLSPASNLAGLRDLTIFKFESDIHVQTGSEPEPSNLDNSARVDAEFIKIERKRSLQKWENEENLFGSFSKDSKFNTKTIIRNSELEKIKAKFNKKMKNDKVANALFTKWKPHQVLNLQGLTAYEQQQQNIDSGIRKTVSMFRNSISEKEARAYKDKKKEALNAPVTLPSVEKLPEQKISLQKTKDIIVIPK